MSDAVVRTPSASPRGAVPSRGPVAGRMLSSVLSQPPAAWFTGLAAFVVLAAHWTAPVRKPDLLALGRQQTDGG